MILGEGEGCKQSRARRGSPWPKHVGWSTLGGDAGGGTRLESHCVSRGHEKDKEDSSLLDIKKLELQISDVGAAGKGVAKVPLRRATQEIWARNATPTIHTDRARTRGTQGEAGEGRCIFSCDDRLMPTLGSSGPFFLLL